MDALDETGAGDDPRMIRFFEKPLTLKGDNAVESGPERRWRDCERSSKRCMDQKEYRRTDTLGIQGTKGAQEMQWSHKRAYPGEGE